MNGGSEVLFDTMETFPLDRGVISATCLAAIWPLEKSDDLIGCSLRDSLDRQITFVFFKIFERYELRVQIDYAACMAINASWDIIVESVNMSIRRRYLLSFILLDSIN